MCCGLGRHGGRERKDREREEQIWAVAMRDSQEWVPLSVVCSSCPGYVKLQTDLLGQPQSTGLSLRSLHQSAVSQEKSTI